MNSLSFKPILINYIADYWIAQSNDWTFLPWSLHSNQSIFIAMHFPLYFKNISIIISIPVLKNNSFIKEKQDIIIAD